jgi:hypothetical protein
MTAVVNVIMFAAIALIPLALAVLFIRLGRRWSTASSSPDRPAAAPRWRRRILRRFPWC